MIHIYFKVIQLPALWSFTTMLISSDVKTILLTVEVQGWPMTMMVYYSGSGPCNEGQMIQLPVMITVFITLVVAMLPCCSAVQCHTLKKWQWRTPSSVLVWTLIF